MEIMEADIPLQLRELLSAMKGALGREGAELKGYDFRQLGLQPFFGIYPKGSTNPLLTVSVDDNNRSMRITPSHSLSPAERDIAKRYAGEFSSNAGYKLVP